MKFFRSAYRRIVRLVLYTHAFIYAILTGRRIVIQEFQTSGTDGFWQVSYRAILSTPSRRMHLEFLRAAPAETTFYKTALAIKIAEDICREQYLPPTPVFIKVDGVTIVVIVKEN